MNTTIGDIVTATSVKRELGDEKTILNAVFTPGRGRKYVLLILGVAGSKELVDARFGIAALKRLGWTPPPGLEEKIAKLAKSK